MKNLFLYVCCTLLLASCGGDRMTDAEAMGIEPAPGVVPPPPHPVSDTLQGSGVAATYLQGFPSTIVEGCDCTLFLDGAGTDDQQLFFVFNWNEGPGVIGVNGRELVVERGASLSPADSPYDSYLHESPGFQVQTSLTREGAAGDEGSAYSGKVNVKNKETGEKMSFSVTGTCSC